MLRSEGRALQIDRVATVLVVQVLDLGLARVIESTSPAGQSVTGSLTQTGAYMGTVDFTTPEQAEASKKADHRADIYSLGCTLYYLLTARPPFEGETLLKKVMGHQKRRAPSLHAARSDVPEPNRALGAYRRSSFPMGASAVWLSARTGRGSPPRRRTVSGSMTYKPASVKRPVGSISARKGGQLIAFTKR
jgi:serine/threonine protein kinase